MSKEKKQAADLLELENFANKIINRVFERNGVIYKCKTASVLVTSRKLAIYTITKTIVVYPSDLPFIEIKGERPEKEMKSGEIKLRYIDSIIKLYELDHLKVNSLNHRRPYLGQETKLLKAYNKGDLKLKLQDVADILNRSVHSVNSTCYRLRKEALEQAREQINNYKHG